MIYTIYIYSIICIFINKRFTFLLIYIIDCRNILLICNIIYIINKERYILYLSKLYIFIYKYKYIYLYYGAIECLNLIGWRTF